VYRQSALTWGRYLIGGTCGLLTPVVAVAADAELGTLGNHLATWSVAPFIALLLCIAVLPLAWPHHWEPNRNKGLVAALLGIPVAVYLLQFGESGQHALLHAGKDYVSFIVLLLALFTISGNIYVQGSLSGTPLVNTLMIGLGAVLANFVGTTGASMLLIRPLLRANQARQKKVHLVVFFIFIVSNAGGLLTPLGDPPLFLGFLAGVPFTWTFQLAKQWGFVCGVLLVLFHLWDQVVFNKEERERPGSQLEEVQRHEPLRVRGLLNVVFLAAIVAVIFCQGKFGWQFGIAESAMLAITAAAYWTSPVENRLANKFTFGPIIEVAVLFAGIFITMTPAVKILEAQGSRLGLTEPWQFFWASGLLSSFLDNAPTYVTFAAAANGVKGIANDSLLSLINVADGSGAALLMAISCGSVFMGANSYIGNGPNFMVKAIAEENGVKMPSFFGYMAYSVGILIPVFIAVTIIFFR